MRPPNLTLPATLLLSLASGCLPSTDGTPPPITVGPLLQAEYVVSGAASPTAVAIASDGRVFYTEKNTGRIRVVVDGTLQDAPFAEVAVNAAGDRGLLGLALHPDFDRNGRVYIFYTRSDTGLTTTDLQAVVDNRVVYFESVDNVAIGGEVFVTSLPATPGATRVGGRIAFAPDGKLFVSLGDLENPDAVQDGATLFGKVLRLNADGSIPSDNPTPGSPVFALGLRDGRGLTVDPVSHAPFATDKNPNGRNELNRINAGGNYGWPVVTGVADSATAQAFVSENPNYVDPMVNTRNMNTPLVGGGVNPAARYGPDAQNRFFYGEASARQVISLLLTNDRGGVAAKTTFAADFPSNITDVVFTPAGTLYVACETAILRVVPLEL